MESVNKLFYMAFAAIMFCVGVFILISSSNQYRKTLEIVREKYKDDSTLYQQFNPEDEEIVTYAELIATLFYQLDYDIEIDGELIRKDIHNRDFIESYGIQNTNYIKNYEYNDKGDIIKIIYSRVTD